MVRVGGQVVDVAGVWSDDDVGIELTDGVVPLVPVEAIDGGVEGLHEAEHVIEGAVFQHQDDEMLDRGRHRGVPQISSVGPRMMGQLITKALTIVNIFDGYPWVLISDAISRLPGTYFRARRFGLDLSTSIRACDSPKADRDESKGAGQTIRTEASAGAV